MSLILSGQSQLSVINPGVRIKRVSVERGFTVRRCLLTAFSVCSLSVLSCEDFIYRVERTEIFPFSVARKRYQCYYYYRDHNAGTVFKKEKMKST